MEEIGVAEAKRRFAELIDRVRAGERVVVTRRGRPVLMLAPPELHASDDDRPEASYVSFAALAGLLGEGDDGLEDVEVDEIVNEIYAARRRDRGRPAPGFE